MHGPMDVKTISRSSKLCTQHRVYVKLACRYH